LRFQIASAASATATTRPAMWPALTGSRRRWGTSALLGSWLVARHGDERLRR
jgi:hypothetical protein